jgi:hypothetical protein
VNCGRSIIVRHDVELEGPGQEMGVYQIDLGEVVSELEEMMKRWKVLNKK